MKILIATAAVLMSGTVLAQASRPNDATMAGSIPGNTGTVTNGAATNQPGSGSMSGTGSMSGGPMSSGSMSGGGTSSGSMSGGSTSGTMASGHGRAMSASSDMTMSNGHWMMNGKRASKSQIASWKKSNPGMTQPQ